MLQRGAPSLPHCVRSDELARQRRYLSELVPGSWVVGSSAITVCIKKRDASACIPLFYAHYYCLAFCSLGGTYQQCLHLTLSELSAWPSVETCWTPTPLRLSANSSRGVPPVVRRWEKSLRSSEVRHLPVSSSNCQPCMVHVRTPFSILPNRVRSAFRCGQRRWIR